MKHLTLVLISAIFAILMACPLAGAEKHPFYEMIRAIGSARDSFDSLEIIEQKLNEIVPRECEVDEIKISKSEMEFLLNIWKLDFAITLKKAERALKYAQKVQNLMRDSQIDFKKLSKLLKGIKVETIADIDIPMAYIVANRAEDILESLQEKIKKYKKGTFEYTMLRFALGQAFYKTQQPDLALGPTLEAYEYFQKEGQASYAALAASNLSAIYLAKNDKVNAKKYQEIAMAGAKKTKSKMIECEQALVELFKLWDLDQKMTAAQKQLFESKRAFILQNTTSDMHFWATYVISTLIKTKNEFPTEDILADLEKALLYRAMIWGDSKIVDDNVKVLDEALNELKKEMFKRLSDTKQIDRLNYWKANFERSTQRKMTMAQMAQNPQNIKLMPLFEAVSKYEQANQILVFEGQKPAALRDKAMISKATAIKRNLERMFDAAKKQLSKTDAQKLESLLSDNYIIHPDSLGQLAKVLPPRVACIQYLLIENRVIVYLLSRDTTPFMTIIDLTQKGLDGRKFIGKILRARTLLQANAPVESLKKELNGIYDVLFKDIEPAIRRLQCNILLINSSGILRYLPFAALYDGNKYLVEKYQITNITGLDLIRLGQHNVGKTIMRTNAVIFADPDGTLPEGKNEGKFVANLFSNAKLYVGDKATLDEFETLLGNVNFIHLATHAVLDSNSPEDSYILFAQGKKWKYADMMGFHAKDIDSIVLSACSTAVSENSTGGEIEGMAYQLLRKSPSGSVLASFWNVDDRATSLLMKTYYSHIVESIKKTKKLNRGEALHRAQLKLLQNPGTSSPYYWAAFTLFGDFR